MKNRYTNYLDMIGTRITVANLAPYKSVWLGNDPADFETDLTAEYAATTALASQIAGAPTGPADAKDVAETTLENLAHQLARALAIHFKKTGNLADHAKVNVRIGAIQKLRHLDLLTLTKSIRDLGTTATAHPDAAKRGVTAARVTALTGAINLFDELKDTPRGNIVNRSTILREVETRTAGLLEANKDLDDLAIQFDDTEIGLQFIAAWKQAGIIVDAGHGPGEEDTNTPVVTP